MGGTQAEGVLMHGLRGAEAIADLP